MHRVKCEEAETFHRCVAKPHRSFAELDFLSLRGCCATRSDRRASHEGSDYKSALKTEKAADLALRRFLTTVSRWNEVVVREFDEGSHQGAAGVAECLTRHRTVADGRPE